MSVMSKKAEPDTLRFPAGEAADRRFYVCEYDGENDSARIAACLTDAKAAGPGTAVVFDKRDYVISEAILLSSGMTVIVDDCAIIQADETFDNVFRTDNLVLKADDPWGEAVEVAPVENIRVIGVGSARIVGCEKNRIGFHSVLGREMEMTGDYWGWRNYALLFANAKNFEVGGLQFSKTRSWALTFDWCRQGSIHDIDVMSTVKNGDGVHLLSGCSDIVIQDITGITSDDTIAIQAGFILQEYPTKNYLYPLSPAYCLYRAAQLREWDTHDITVRRVRAGGSLHNVVCLANNAARVYSVTLEDIEDTVCSEPYFATVFLYTGIYGEAGTLSDIRIRGVKSRARSAVVVNTNIDGLCLSALEQRSPGGKLIDTWRYKG